MDIERTAGLISIVNTSFGYIYGIGPRPIANKIMKINVNTNETIAKEIHFLNAKT